MNKKTLEALNGLACSASVSDPSSPPACTAEAGKLTLDSLASMMPYV